MTIIGLEKKSRRRLTLATVRRFRAQNSETFPPPAGYSEHWNFVFRNKRQPTQKTKMKNSLCICLVTALLAAGLILNAHAATSTGQVDFGQFAAPGKGEEFVEVRLQSNLLAIAAQLVSKAEPDAAKLLNSVESVRVNVVGLTADNREELTERVRKIRDDLSAQGWEQNVNVQGKKGEDVGIFTKTGGTEALAGVVITVIDDEHMGLVNGVGDIKPDQGAA